LARHRRGFAIAAGLLLVVHWSATNATPPFANVQLLGQQALLADAPGSLRVRVTHGKTNQPLPAIRSAFT